MPLNVFAPNYHTPGSSFVVKNITTGNKTKTVRIFNYPIPPGKQRDMFAIPGIGQGNIKDSIIKGEIRNKLLANEIKIAFSDLDLLQFNDQEIAFLYASGITTGIEIVGGGGLTPNQHARLRQLIHLGDAHGPFEGFSGAYKETTPISPFPTSIIWWEDSSKAGKIVEKTITYNPNKTPSTIVYRVYDTDGITLLATATDTLTYNGVFESSRTRIIT